jgi:hypothetical protein
MKTEIERKTAKALDMLSPTQIVALCNGSLGMGDRIRNHPHPRKTNAAARGNTADLYQMVLEDELFYGLTKRDPDKTRRIVQAMRWSNDSRLETMSYTLEKRLKPTGLQNESSRSNT